METPKGKICDTCFNKKIQDAHFLFCTIIQPPYCPKTGEKIDWEETVEQMRLDHIKKN